MLNTAAESETKCRHKRNNEIIWKLPYSLKKQTNNKKNICGFQKQQFAFTYSVFRTASPCFLTKPESERLLGVLHVIKVQPGKSLQGVTNLPGAGLLL